MGGMPVTMPVHGSRPVPCKHQHLSPASVMRLSLTDIWHPGTDNHLVLVDLRWICAPRA